MKKLLILIFSVLFILTAFCSCTGSYHYKKTELSSEELNHIKINIVNSWQSEDSQTQLIINYINEGNTGICSYNTYNLNSNSYDKQTCSCSIVDNILIINTGGSSLNFCITYVDNTRLILVDTNDKVTVFQVFIN